MKKTLPLIAVLLVCSIRSSCPAQSERFQYRWVYVMTNLQVKENVGKLIGLMQRAKKAGYNGMVIADSKMQRLASVPSWYFDDVHALLLASKDIGMEIYPAIFPVGYADGMLSNNPNLIEAMPVKDALYVAGAGSATLAPDAAIEYKNGGFEQAENNKFAGFSFQDGPGQSSFVDTNVVHSGKQSVRMENFAAGNEGGNCRVVQQVTLSPWRQYHLSAWLKTEGLDQHYIQAMLLDSKGKSISFNDVQVKPTQEWTRVDVVFNSRANDHALVYLGIWGGHSGKLWWDDAALEEAGLMNVVRRPGCPLSVRGEDGTVFVEGKDFAPISDPDMGVHPWPGAYDIWHKPPEIKLLSSGRIKPGQRLRVSFFAAALATDHQPAICLSEPGTDAVMVDEATRVNALFNPSGFFFSHDEIRTGGWCDACQKRGLTPGQILAENLKRCTAIIAKVHPKAQTFVWSDMFDPDHNAVDGYYNTNGTLARSWIGLSPDNVVVNWNSGPRRKDSMQFFSSLGCRQILAGYYDGPADSIKLWLNDAAKVKGIAGVMYTTWVDNYADLEAFAKAAWGPGGPK